MKQTTKPAPVPVIDLGARVCVIDDSKAGTPGWKPLARGVASQSWAKRVLSQHGFTSGWLIDDLGYKTFIN